MRLPLPGNFSREVPLLVACLGLATGCCTSHSACHAPPADHGACVPAAVTEYASAESPNFSAVTENEAAASATQPAVELTQFERPITAASADGIAHPGHWVARGTHFGAGGEQSSTQDSTQEPYVIDFSTALALVSGQNPQVAFAHERIHEAFAQRDAAKALWLPSISAGVSYNKHEGNYQASSGQVLDVSRSSLYSGLGADAVGTGSPAVSGLQARFHLADAIFQPIIAERTVAARQYAASAAVNDELLRAALAYLELLGANQELAIAKETLQNSERLAKLTATFAETGQGSHADADRARTELSLRKNEATRAEEATRVASARLAEVLSLEQNFELRPRESTVAPIELVALETSAQDLIATGLSNRPETSESRLLVSEAVERLRREKYAPLIPSVLLGVSGGRFGGGLDSRFGDFKDRFDLDVAAYWEVRNLGFGEKAARDAAHSRVHQAKWREVRVMDRVAREVAEAFAQARSRRQQIAVAESGVEAARDSYRRNAERIHELKGLPIETLQSIQALDQARRDYLRAVTGYSEAQFRLHRALGWPIQ